MKKIKVEGQEYTLAKIHTGKTLECKSSDRQLFVNESGDMIVISKPTVSVPNKDKPYPTINFTVEQKPKTIPVHHVVAGTFFGSRDNWLRNDSPPPKKLVESLGKKEAIKKWNDTDGDVKAALADSAVQVDHEDGDKLNFHKDNLSYMFSSENNQKGGSKVNG